MRVTRRTLLKAAGPLVVAAASKARAQTQAWPARSVRIVVGTAAGGSPDIVSRLLGEKFSERLGQSFVVENNTQAAGIVAEQAVNKSAPDGHTMVMLTAGYPGRAALHQGLAFDPLDGFSFVSLVCGYPFVYSVRPKSPIKSFEDMLARAKAQPGRITYTINAQGSIHHLLTTWIGMEAGVTMTPIPYRGASPAITDVLGGRVDVMVEPATSAFPRVRAGQVRLLAVSSKGRYSLMPEAPTVEEFVPGVDFMSWLGFAMAPKTPATIVVRLNQEIRRALALPEVQKKLVEGGNVATTSTPQEFRDLVESEIERWTKVIAAAGIKAG
jgi:tripartite-type tricarboxylate transporter receptor subunit TctC